MGISLETRISTSVHFLMVCTKAIVCVIMTLRLNSAIWFLPTRITTLGQSKDNFLSLIIVSKLERVRSGLLNTFMKCLRSCCSKSCPIQSVISRSEFLLISLVHPISNFFNGYRFCGLLPLRRHSTSSCHLEIELFIIPWGKFPEFAPRVLLALLTGTTTILLGPLAPQSLLMSINNKYRDHAGRAIQDFDPPVFLIKMHQLFQNLKWGHQLVY